MELRAASRALGERSVVAAVLAFAALSTYCNVRSDGFIAGDACMHYLCARYAFQTPRYFVDVWNRPLVTALYAAPAALGGRIAVRGVSMCVAIACGLVAWRIAKGQRVRAPALALVFTLGQPLLFLHSLGEMTELPFALLLGLAFLAYERERFWLAASIIALAPLARPEGFGFVLLAAVAMLLHRRWGTLLVLPIPVVLWDLVGWAMSDHTSPWWRWLSDSWPYAGQSLYGRGYLLTFAAQLPMVVSPLALPATLIGITLGLSKLRTRYRRESRMAWHGRPAHVLMGIQDEDHERAAHATGVDDNLGQLRERADDKSTAHARRCGVLVAALPLFVLGVHSLLYWLGRMASYGEVRYLLVVAPFWGVLAARGWEWAFERFQWHHAIRWAAAAVIVPPVVANLANPVVPVALTPDWVTAREVATWYQAEAARSGYPRLSGSHPGLYYYLDINPVDPMRVRAWERRTVTEKPAGTVLVWDPEYASRNASADRALSLAEIRRAGWINEWTIGGVGAADDRRWHIFFSPEAGR